MKYDFKVYYRDGSETSWKMSEKFKIIKARNKDAAMKKFSAKYPEYTPIAAF